MHDLILRNRVADYCEGDLMRFLHGARGMGRESERVARGARGASFPTDDRQIQAPCPVLQAEARKGFEHHLPHSAVLVAFPLEAWPHLDAAMQARTKRSSAWSGRLTPREKELAPHILAEIAARGPLGPGDFEDSRKARRVWGAATLAKSVLQKLFFHGRLLIAKRVNNQRRYDLPERVLPAAVLAQKPASKQETERWIAILKVRQFRLALLKKTEVAAAGDAVVPVDIEGCPRVYCLAADLPLLDESRVQSLESRARNVRTRFCTPDRLSTLDSRLWTNAGPVRLLAPLDPLIYQRRLTSALWDFDYTWEVYTPPAKRVRGYYALPILSGAELVGHVDPKADREARRLRVIGRRSRRGHSASMAVRDLSRWLGLR